MRTLFDIMRVMVSPYNYELPAFDTAETRVGSDIQDIPGRMRGYLHPKSDVMRVRMAGAAMVDDDV
eukprot:scaffold59_cov133-Skeletonema_dohrnii-CCMP3373.AAC.8